MANYEFYIDERGCERARDLFGKRKVSPKEEMLVLATKAKIEVIGCACDNRNER